MSSNNDVPDVLQGLAALVSRDDLNLRPVLLRVLTDLFVMKDHHTPDEIRQFEEIALHMVGDIDGEARTAIARKLAAYCAPPPALIERLTVLGGEAAAVLLEASGAVERHALTNAAAFSATVLAIAVARRNDLDTALVRMLAVRPESEVLVALAENRSATIARATFLSLVRRARDDLLLAKALLARADDAYDVAPLFLAASPGQRAAIVLAARRRALGRPRQVARPSDPAFLAELEKLACASAGRVQFTAALATALCATTEAMDKIVDDRTGEPLALVLAALGMMAEATTRIFLMGDPAIAHSYERVASLRQLVENISATTARRLVSRFLDVARQPLDYVPTTDTPANATPSRGRVIALFAPTRGASLGALRLRRSLDRTRR